MPARMGKNKLKKEFREAFLENESWEAPFFKQWHTVSEEHVSQNTGRWVCWDKFVEAEGKDLFLLSALCSSSFSSPPFELLLLPCLLLILLNRPRRWPWSSSPSCLLLPPSSSSVAS
eukprot:7945853-Pyramimonas_sp.AAC.1